MWKNKAAIPELDRPIVAGGLDIAGTYQVNGVMKMLGNNQIVFRVREPNGSLSEFSGNWMRDIIKWRYEESNEKIKKTNNT